MISASRSKVKDSLSSRDPMGISTELIFHYIVRKIAPNHAETADIGSTCRRNQDYDSNALVWECMANKQQYKQIIIVYGPYVEVVYLNV